MDEAFAAPLIAMKAAYTRRQFIERLAGAAGLYLAPPLASSCRSKRASARRPSFLLFIADDLRWDAMGSSGNRVIRTPNLDRLAASGVRFTNNFVTTSVCPSSRASILTGLYTRSHGVTDFRRSLSHTVFARSYPSLLRAAGYRTGFLGKWGIGEALPRGAFDVVRAFSGQGRYFHERAGKTVHQTESIGDDCLEFLEGCSRGEPFCLSVSFKAPHAQDEDPRQFLYQPEYAGLYRDVPIPAPRAADPADFEALPGFVRRSEGRRRWKVSFSDPEKYQESMRAYYRLVTGLDAAVGRVLERLRGRGFADTTVVAFTSDNGFLAGEHGLQGKWLMYEESIRTPLIVHDPRAPGGRRRDEMTLNIDLLPTLLEWAGVEIPVSLQGRSLVPLVEGRRTSWRGEWFYEHLLDHPDIPRCEGVRTERWKYVRYIDQNPPYEELFDLREDAYEERNLAGGSGSSGRLDEMSRRWDVWRRRLGEWSPDAPWHDPP